MGRVDKRVTDKLFNLKNAIGRAGLSTLFPDEFEYYTLSLELLDSNGDTVDYFVFPITPQGIKKKETSIKSIVKTAYGITTFKNPTFAPIEYELSGNFGRDLKVLIGRDQESVSFRALNFKKAFSSTIKTGYGCVKILENIFNQSKKLDVNNKPHTLIMYNPAFGDAFVVEPMEFSIEMDSEGANMIHNYSMSMTAVAPVTAVLTNKKAKQRLAQTLGTSLASQYATASLRAVQDFVRQDIKALDVNIINQNSI